MSSPETVHRRIRSNHAHMPFCLWMCLWKTLVTSTAQRGRDLENVWILHGLCMIESKTLQAHHRRSEHVLYYLCIVMYSFSLYYIMRNYVIIVLKNTYRLIIKKTVHHSSLVNRRLGVVA